jgi:hypothetical protein
MLLYISVAMRSWVLVAVALLVILAGCGGMSGGNASAPAQNGTVGDDAEPAPEPNLQITRLTRLETVPFNDTQLGQVHVLNAGDAAGNATLSVEIGDTVIVTESVSLEPNETDTVSYESSRLRLSEGDYSVEAHLGSDQEIGLFRLDHPSIYGKTNVSLYVDTAGVDRNISSIVANSTSFWEANAERTAGYPIRYEHVNSIAAADQILRYETVAECGNHTLTDYNGCADRPRGDVGGRTVSGSVEQNLSDPYLQETTIHELGHMLGLTHDDAPKYVMEINLSTYTPNTTRVAFETADGGEMDPTIKQEAMTALNYYTDRSIKSKYGFRWEAVASPEDAHLVIRVDSEGCAPERDAGSCPRQTYYKNQDTVMIDEIDDENVAWHVGYILGAFLLDERPPELSSDTDYEDRKAWPEE